MNRPNVARQFTRRNLRKGVYVVPSLFTIGNIFCGFFAVINCFKAVQSTQQPEMAVLFFDHAALAIGLAYFLDGLDGRIARLTGATSEFGVELDSIADVISFGIAPAILAYTWGYGHLVGYEHLAWGISFFFLICGALRLARFNVLARAPRFETPGTTPKLDKRYFVGLPIPAAAGLVAAIIYFNPDPPSITRNWILLGVVLVLAILMVSTFRYASFKDMGPRSKQPFVAIPLMAALFSSIYFFSRYMLLALALTYVLHGPVLKIWWMFGRKRKLSPDDKNADTTPLTEDA